MFKQNGDRQWTVTDHKVMCYYLSDDFGSFQRLKLEWLLRLIYVAKVPVIPAETE